MQLKNILLKLLFGSSLLLLVACNNNTNNVSEEPPSSLPAFNVKISLNKAEENFDIHTDEQNNYLNDSYDKIDSYGKGTSENSKPRALSLSWEITDLDVDLTNIRLDISENIDMQDSISYLLEKDTKTANIDNLKLGTNYFWTITAISDDKEVTSEPSNFSTKDGTVRFINIDGLSNVRDCGGWKGLDGKRIKQGLLYRGEEFNAQNNGRKGSGSTATTDPEKVDPDESIERSKEKPYGQKITEKGINTVLKELKIKTECDVRGYETFDWETNVNDAPVECGGLHNGRGIILDINYDICPVHTNRDKIYYDNYGKAACKHFFSMLADKDNYLPLYFHCAQGKDRTGFLAYLFEAFLGCSKEDMLRDYLLSNMGKTGTVSISKLTNNYNYVDYFDGKLVSTEGGIKYQGEGSNTAEIAYNYLLSCGLTNDQLDTIRNTFLD